MEQLSYKNRKSKRSAKKWQNRPIFQQTGWIRNLWKLTQPTMVAHSTMQPFWLDLVVYWSSICVLHSLLHFLESSKLVSIEQNLTYGYRGKDTFTVVALALQNGCKTYVKGALHQKVLFFWTILDHLFTGVAFPSCKVMKQAAIIYTKKCTIFQAKVKKRLSYLKGEAAIIYTQSAHKKSAAFLTQLSLFFSPWP